MIARVGNLVHPGTEIQSGILEYLDLSYGTACMVYSFLCCNGISLCQEKCTLDLVLANFAKA